MKVSPRLSTLSAVTALTALVAGFAALPLTQAGPGIQAWRPSDPVKSEYGSTTPAVVRGCTGCSDMKTVDVTTATATLPNGRGPLLTATIGTNQVCQSCSSGSFVMKPSGANGRGPMQAQPVASSHVCQGMAQP